MNEAFVPTTGSGIKKELIAELKIADKEYSSNYEMLTGDISSDYAAIIFEHSDITMTPTTPYPYGTNVSNIYVGGQITSMMSFSFPANSIEPLTLPAAKALFSSIGTGSYLMHDRNGFLALGNNERLLTYSGGGLSMKVTGTFRFWGLNLI